MPRRLRISTAGYTYHVLDRAVRQMRLFGKQRDLEAFEEVIGQASHRGSSATRSDRACNPRYVRAADRGQNHQNKDSRSLCSSCERH